MIRAAAKNHALCHRCHRSARLWRADRRARSATTAQTSYAFRQRWRRPPMRAPPLMMRRSRAGWPMRINEPFPRRRAFGGELAQTMRYGENPHQLAALLRRWLEAHRRRHGASASGQGTVLQQHQRHRRRLRAGLRNLIPPTARPASSSNTPIPAVWRAARLWPRPIARRLTATAPRPSAALSR